MPCFVVSHAPRMSFQAELHTVQSLIHHSRRVSPISRTPSSRCASTRARRTSYPIDWLFNKFQIRINISSAAGCPRLVRTTIRKDHERENQLSTSEGGGSRVVRWCAGCDGEEHTPVRQGILLFRPPRYDSQQLSYQGVPICGAS